MGSEDEHFPPFFLQYDGGGGPEIINSYDANVHYIYCVLYGSHDSCPF